ncbi:class I SAM-dependent methyltransferase [bacterium]|nr:class I SAM-dependent methyltransferase [bacterium]MBU1883795.1 class I SAM-dependent methyltransferase [bacterium]
MNNSWIIEQTKINVAQWDSAMENAYPEVKEWNKDPYKYYNQVCEKCNFLESVKIVDWEKYLVEDAKIIDMGSGGGWLSAYLSKFDLVKSIIALDTSKNYLYKIMPDVIKIMDGQVNKIQPIEGLFAPLLLDDGSLDMVVASAALHHADNLELVLKEIRSKLKEGGILVILNETPSGQLRYIARLLLAFAKILKNTMLLKYKRLSPEISSSGFKYDPYLGDRSYPIWFWKEAIRLSGFELIELIDSELSTVKGIKNQSLKHFVCKAI